MASFMVSRAPSVGPLSACSLAVSSGGRRVAKKPAILDPPNVKPNGSSSFGALSLAMAGAVTLLLQRRGRRRGERIASFATAAKGGANRGFRRRKLGASNLVVPEVCLGTMTWGQQNTEEEAHEQLDYAVKERGVTFLDTAEMYPVPTRAETQGRTERYIGSWMKKSGVPRSEIVLATKVSGFSKQMHWVRDAGAPVRVSRAQIREAVEKSLNRLGTDYIDLLQIHWPDRYVSLFGAEAYDERKRRPNDVPFEEQLEAFAELQREGLVRHFGVSNETSFGVMSFIRAAEERGLPRIASIQNSYSLLVRSAYETDLAEVCSAKNCNVGLLAYSPLAGGVLSGKYLSSASSPSGRFSLFPSFMNRYRNSASEAATREYVALANAHGLSATQLALAWCRQRWCVTSTIIGATSVEQLKENLDAFQCTLSKDVLKDIQLLYKRYRDPTVDPVG